MNVIDTAIPDVKIIEPKVFGDTRGFFYESFNDNRFRDATGLDIEFVQDNHSKSGSGCCADCITRSNSHRES